MLIGAELDVVLAAHNDDVDVAERSAARRLNAPYDAARLQRQRRNDDGTGRARVDANRCSARRNCAASVERERLQRIAVTRHDVEAKRAVVVARLHAHRCRR